MDDLFQLKQYYEPRIRKTYSEKEKIVLLNEYADKLRMFDLKRSHELAEEAYYMAVPLFDKKNMADSLKIIGACLSRGRNYEAAVAKLQEAVELYQQFNEYSSIARCYILIGHSCSDMGDDVKALEWFAKGYIVAEKHDLKLLEAYSVQGMGTCYVRLKEFDKAFNHYEQAGAIFSALNDLTGFALNNNNLGFAYSSKGELEKSLHHFLKALEMFRQTGNTINVGLVLLNIGAIQCELKQFDDALVYLNESLTLHRKTADRLGYSATYFHIADVYMGQKRYEKALYNYNQAMRIAEELNSKPMLVEIIKAIVRYYDLTGDPAKAAAYREKQSGLEKELLAASV